MNKTILLVAMIALVASIAISGYAMTGFFSKAFDKTLSPGDVYERNITVRQFYNLTVRFQKEDSSSYLTFDNNETKVVLKDSSDNQIANGTGVINAKMYFFMNKQTIDAIAKVSAFNLGTYDDVIDQTASISFSGTTAYLTVKVKTRAARVQGFVVDELTQEPVESVKIIAVKNSEDPNVVTPQAEAITDGNGFYNMSFNLTTSTALDFYVKDYEVV